MDNIWTVYTGNKCIWCIRAKELLDIQGITYEEVKLNDPEQGANYEALERLNNLGLKTVPQIFLNDKLIGGFTDLEKFIEEKNNKEDEEIHG